MFQAIKEGDISTLNKMNVDIPKMRDTTGYGPLVVAAGHGRDEIVKYLIDVGCDILLYKLLFYVLLMLKKCK